MKLVCMGASNPETIRVVHAIERARSDFQFLGFIDDDEEKWGKSFFEYTIFGGIEKIAELHYQGAKFCNLLGKDDCRARYERTRAIVAAGARLGNLIHPTVNLEMVRLGLGIYIQEGVIMQGGVSIGDNTNIQMGVRIGHGSSIGNSVLIAPACSMAGNVTIEDGVFAGIGATIRPGVSVGRWSVIGAGAVIVSDIPPYSLVVGVPARVIGQVEIDHANGRVLPGAGLYTPLNEENHGSYVPTLAGAGIEYCHLQK